MWSEEQIADHVKAAELLLEIKDLAFEFIREREKISEWDVQQFILKKFLEFGLVSDKVPPIIAFRESTANAHYFPGKDPNVIADGDLVMIDIWGRLDKKGAPFADITWMGFRGEKVLEEFSKVWDVVLRVRDESIELVRDRAREGRMPLGCEVYGVTNDVLAEEGFGKDNHYTGHSLGLNDCHGEEAHLTSFNEKELFRNLGYTIEPGIYLDGKFGIRSEIDFYVSGDGDVVLTAGLQRDIILV